MDHLARDLLDWYQSNGRQLPWRRSRDPYAIWIAEIMLQQTRVETVLPYYQRWMSRFPKVEDVAESTLDEVLNVWEGLGYYRRARYLHQAAQIIVDQHQSQLPSEPKVLRELPGIGEYTSAAISAIAFDQDTIALDGNLKRVLARLYDIRLDIKLDRTKGILLERAQEILPKGRASDFNQALMDLGASVCTPKSPACPDCPLQAHCLAYEKGIQSDIPVRSSKGQIPHKRRVIAVVHRQHHVLVARRPSDGLLADMWEFPGIELPAGANPVQFLRTWMNENLGVISSKWRLMTQLEHAYSHFSVSAQAYSGEWKSGQVQTELYPQHSWTTFDDLDMLPMGKIDRSIANAIKQQRAE